MTEGGALAWSGAEALTLDLRVALLLASARHIGKRAETCSGGIVEGDVKTDLRRVQTA